MNKDEKIALCALEQNMTPEGLADKYGTADSWGEHPVFTRKDWKYEVVSGNTLLGYWASVVNEIDRIACGDLDDEDDEN